jgi:hypothetical protein
MTKVRITVLVVAAATAFVAIASVARFGLTSSCPPTSPVELTGTLVEVRQNDTALPNDDPIFLVMPRVVCLKPRGYSPGEQFVEISDCYDSRFTASFRMESP